MDKTDLRIIKTKRALFDALINLMKNKSFEEIKVSDICTEALVNRSTFYAHYNDKYELLMDYINTLKTSLIDALSKNSNIHNTKAYYMELIKILLDHIDERKDIYYSILINNRNSIVLDILLDVVSKDLKTHIQEENVKIGSIPSDVISRFYLGAVVSIGLEWLNNSTKYTKEELLTFIDTLIPNEVENL